MYHVELRQFPHNFCHFNLTSQALRETVLDAWARGQWVEVGERRWNPLQATLTVIEGPQLSVSELSMGRGWRNASRQGTNVTADLLADARQRLGLADSVPADAAGALSGPPPGIARSAWSALTGPSSPRASGPAPAGTEGKQTSATPSGTGDQPAADEALVRQLLPLLGPHPGPLLRAWLLALEQHPDSTPSQCLALAEDFVCR
ncbi:MAG: hypothetical protein WB998_09845 [Solirubrobacteraceae bacterium]